MYNFRVSKFPFFAFNLRKLQFIPTKYPKHVKNDYSIFRGVTRALSEISSKEDHEDQERIRRLKALMEISMTEGETSHKAERMQVKSSKCQVCPDVAVTPHDKSVFYNSNTGK